MMLHRLWNLVLINLLLPLTLLRLPSLAAVDDSTTDDAHENCLFWASKGECNANPDWMWKNCKSSCNKHSSGPPKNNTSRAPEKAATTATADEDTHDNCPFWASRGECNANPDWMWNNCKSSCYKHSQKEIVAALNTTSGYGETIGADGLPFNMETVLRRTTRGEETTSCGATTTTQEEECSIVPSIVRLPENYPANLTLGPPLPEGAEESTLDQLHEKGILAYADYMHPRKTTHGSPVAVKVINFQRRRFKKMWDDGGAGVYNGDITGGLGDRSVLMTYAGHTFDFIDAKTNQLYRRITMKSDVHYIVFEPDDDDYGALASEQYAAAKREEKFMKEYYEHHGTPWLAKYGRPAPVLNTWPAEYLGQTHTVETEHGHWICDDPTNAEACYSNQKLTLDLVVASHAGVDGPRVLVIPNLMSDAECDHVLRMGKQVVKDSTVGQGGAGFKSASRTSSTGWLRRDLSPILETMQKRFADVLGLDEKRLVASDLAEHLQVVRYEHGQKYNPHHDFADSSSDRYGQRFLTLLLYVVVPENGGHTSFPKAFGGRGMRVKPPERGGAVLFYSMLPDGNGDDLSLHGGEAVAGDEEKWVCNLWVWDPNRSD